MTWIKVCGITSKPDAEAAIHAGASAIGLVFANSPRQVTLEKAVGIAALARGRAQVVGVFRDPGQVEATHAVVRFDLVQIHSAAPLDPGVPVLRAVHPDHLDGFQMSDSETILIDSSQGRGITFDWTRLQSRPGRFVIAGGLTPENVETALARSRAFGVDVSSGVESAPGRKDPDKMQRFVAAVRRADAAR